MPPVNEHQDYKIADPQLAEQGRLEIELAQSEMPALMSFRDTYGTAKPLQGAKIVGCLHMTIETAVLMETLMDLGAQLRWSSCNIFSTQDHAAAAMVARGVPVYAWKGQSCAEGEWCIEQTLHKDGRLWDATMLLDDGGDLTEMVHQRYPQLLPRLYGVTEETTTGVMRLRKRLQEDSLKIPAIDVNASVTKSKNDNRYGCRHSLSDALKRATDQLLAGKKALVMGYGDVGKGSALSLRAEGMIVRIAEIDPICAMQACMDGYEVVSPYRDGVNTENREDVNARLLQDTDVLITATGNIFACDGPMLDALKPTAVVANIGHFDHEIHTEYLRHRYRWQQIKPGVHKVVRSSDSKDYIVLLAEGRLVNLGCATGHPSRVMDGSFANQVLAQMHLWQQRSHTPSLSELPKHLDEQVARLIVAGFGGTITRLTPKQADYIAVPIDGPYKPENYRY